MLPFRQHYIQNLKSRARFFDDELKPMDLNASLRGFLTEWFHFDTSARAKIGLAILNC